MNRMASLVAFLFLAFSAYAFAQRPQPNPQGPDDVASQQLVAWTWMQKPQPAPHPLPPPDTPIPQSQPQAKPQADQSTPQQTSPQTFTGRIVKDGVKYILKVATTSYQLDQQGGLAQYENQEVKVIGSLDPGSNTISVVKIELLS